MTRDGSSIGASEPISMTRSVVLELAREGRVQALAEVAFRPRLECE